ncbi:MAG: 6-carboxytetrahydropterin synthase QueD [Chitinispirillales bacterium]|jgi:6-pyruvoyltetrahydropterin/6-carboxytetrahydropterin synthase|nr:6-carboxytetrahydropterin synthase QueD [Chitinispirillales bacterium]
MYDITTESHFSAAHCLRNYNGPCENLHGHNWLVRATVKCDALDKSGLGLDFKVLKRRLNDILDGYDHKNLNDAFDAMGESPSSECIARHIYRRLSESLADTKGVRVARVEVQETPGNSAAYYEH